MFTGKLLILEDDTLTSKLLAKTLTQNGHTVTNGYSGTEGRLLLEREAFDCILMNLGLPGLDGESLIAEIRQKETLPIIVISGKPGIEVRINALRLGADDFIPKPFAGEEVLARVEAQLRRCYVYSLPSQPVKILIWKNCTLNTETSEIAVNDKILKFTALQLRIMETLMRYPQRLFTRSDLFEICWGQKFMGNENTLAVHINHIRKKIALADPHMKYIKTVRGIGFRLSE